LRTHLRAFSCLHFSHAYYFKVFPLHIKPKKYVRAVFSGLFISFVAAIASYVVMRYLIETGHLIDMDNGGKNGRSTALRVIVITAFIATISGIVALVIKGFTTWFEEIKLKEALQQKNHETEMALVKAQLDPHFLFNTLNNIDVLIMRNPAEASAYLNKLSDILRFMLYETQTDEILLQQEIQYIEKYIELQKIRTSNASYVSFTVTGDAGLQTISPMVFIPFIENAFKHTTNKKTDNAINVQLNIEKQGLEFICENKFDTARNVTNESTGLGNALIQKRLHLLYPEKHNLTIRKENNIYSVHLTIKNG
jgi:two-component system, LytTR family, sensor kinase